MISKTGNEVPVITVNCPMCGKSFSKRWDDPEPYCDEHRLEGM